MLKPLKGLDYFFDDNMPEDAYEAMKPYYFANFLKAPVALMLFTNAADHFHEKMKKEEIKRLAPIFTERTVKDAQWKRRAKQIDRNR